MEGLSYCADVGVLDHVVNGRWPTSCHLCPTSVFGNSYSVSHRLYCIYNVSIVGIILIFFNDFLRNSAMFLCRIFVFWLKFKNVKLEKKSYIMPISKELEIEFSYI